jgi:hypothetical protein
MEPTCAIDVRIVRKREHAMGSTMPFSKLHLDPEHIEAMRAAFNRVCEVPQLECDREDPLTELVVLKILERAKAGERDPQSLSFDVLAELGHSSRPGGWDTAAAVVRSEGFDQSASS